MLQKEGNMKKSMKRLLAMVMSLVMILSMMPMWVLATEDPTGTGESTLTAAQSFIGSYLMEGRSYDESKLSEIYKEATESNYAQIISGEEAWEKLTEDEKTEVNAAIDESGDVTYDSLLTAAKELQEEADNKEAQAFVTKYLTDSDLKIIGTVDESNYAQILSGEEKWNSMTEAQKEKVNTLLSDEKDAAHNTYEKYLNSANTIKKLVDAANADDDDDNGSSSDTTDDDTTTVKTYNVTFKALGPISISGEKTVTEATQYTATIKKKSKSVKGYTNELPDSVVVKVGGEVVDSSKYSYSSTTGKVILPKTIVTGDINILASAPFKVTMSPGTTFTKGKATKNYVMKIGHGVSALKAGNLEKLYVSTDSGKTWKLLTEKTYYTKKTTGSISITLPKTALLNKLAAGTYKFKAKFDGSFSDQTLRTTMVVKAATTSSSSSSSTGTTTTATRTTTTPTTTSTTASTATNTAATTRAETSDNMNVIPYIVAMVMCAGVMAGVVYKKKRS